MKRNCPHCRFYLAWKLKDGRFKCRQCGKRYTFRSVWQVSRIADQMKHVLVHNFSEDHSAESLSVSGQAQIRFLRLLRMTIAYHEHYSTSFSGPSLTILHNEAPQRDSLSLDHPSTLVLGMHQSEQRVRVFPIFGPDASHLVNMVHTQNGAGRLHYTTERHAFGLLSLQNNMVMAEDNPEVPTDTSDCIEGFWQKLNQWMFKYHTIPFSELHLFIGEMSFRFHHRNQDLSPLILKWAKQTPYHVIKHM